MNLEELLEVEVGDLRLVVDSQQLGKCCVREDSASEGWVKAAVALDILGDELGHIRLGALLTCLESHELAELGAEWLLLEEGIVGTTSLPGCSLLWVEGGWVNLALLLGVTGLLLGCLGCLLGGLDCITNTGGELGGECLELLREVGEEGIGGLGRCSDNNCRGTRGDGGHDDFHLGGGHLLLLGLNGLGGGGCWNGGGGDWFGGLLLGLLVGGHLVCFRDRYC